MKTWKKVTLREVADIIPGYAFKGEDFCITGAPVIKIKDINPPSVLYDTLERVNLSRYKNNNIEKYTASQNDFVIAMTGATIGKVGKIRFSDIVYINQRVAKIRPKEEVCWDFIYYCAISNLFYQYIINNIDSNSAQENISATSIGSFSFCLPPLPEQKAIAAVLGSLDDKIDLLQRQNATLEAMAETLFRQWFIEEAQEGWGEQAFGNIVTFYDSKRIPLSKREREKMQNGLLYPYYGAAQIVDYVNNFIFNGDYLLIAEDGTVRTDSGTPVLQRAYGKFWVNNHTHVITVTYPYNNDFLYILLLRRNIDELITGAVQPKISQSNLRKLSIPYYPVELVKKYIFLTKDIFSKIRSNQKQIRTLEKLRDTLLPKLMSGEVRVRVDG